MARVLAIDYGLKRCGIAVTDPLCIIANALETIETKSIFEFLKNYFVKEEVTVIVVGFPYNHGHQQNSIAKDINQFIKKMETDFPDKRITKIDERYTSAMATKAIQQSGKNRKEKHDKSLIDKISATIILQSWMEMNG